MTRSFRGWSAVSQRLLIEAERQSAASSSGERNNTLNEGQIRALRKLASNLPQNGMVLADEVGMGKTRIAATLTKAVLGSGGRVGILIPRGLSYQWRDELRAVGVDDAPVASSLRDFLRAFGEGRDPQSHWFQQPVVLISHRIADWRLSSSADPWRWQLVPHLYTRWQKLIRGALPRGGRQFCSGSAAAHAMGVTGAATAVVQAAYASPKGPVARQLDELIEQVSWGDARNPSQYGSNMPLRLWLERSVGMGLGPFDLVVVDEAHKNRSQDSSLSRLLNSVILTSGSARSEQSARRLALTATPLELSIADWAGTFERIGVDVALVTPAIERYAAAVKAVRACPTSDSELREFKHAAAAFRTALAPYLMRRDKREMPAVQAFTHGTDTGVGEYRYEREIKVKLENLEPAWREAICAAEAISQLKSTQQSPLLQRLRLTIGNGHGVLAVMDESRKVTADHAQLAFEEWRGDPVSGNSSPGTQVDQSAAERLIWWQGTLRRAVERAMRGSLYWHPGILAAVDAIESADEHGEKVLVFGRFTEPMKALTEILNARRMLRNLVNGKPWPQSSLPGSAWPAVCAAHAQLALGGKVEDFIDQLQSQYTALERGRQHIRDNLLTWLKDGLSGHEKMARAIGVLALLEQDVIAPLARALTDAIGEQALQAQPADWAQAFVELLEAIADRDAMDDEGPDTWNSEREQELAQEFASQLEAQYSGTKGAFARRMHGGTALPTRRLLQLAFNHPQSYPRVLVAQSLVGREGLNLHKACRTVVLLHPEWNPGVMEQQVGRVDRVGSRWEADLASARALGLPPSEWPRIEVRPVIVEGTYDEHNWRVLRERWDELRAQLHGIVIPPRDVGSDPAMATRVREINACAPSFSPGLGDGLIDQAISPPTAEAQVA